MGERIFFKTNMHHLQVGQSYGLTNIDHRHVVDDVGEPATRLPLLDGFARVEGNRFRIFPDTHEGESKICLSLKALVVQMYEHLPDADGEDRTDRREEEDREEKLGHDGEEDVREGHQVDDGGDQSEEER